MHNRHYCVTFRTNNSTVQHHGCAIASLCPALCILSLHAMWFGDVKWCGGSRNGLTCSGCRLVIQLYSSWVGEVLWSLWLLFNIYLEKMPLLHRFLLFLWDWVRIERLKSMHFLRAHCNGSYHTLQLVLKVYIYIRSLEQRLHIFHYWGW